MRVFPPTLNVTSGLKAHLHSCAATVLLLLLLCSSAHQLQADPDALDDEAAPHTNTCAGMKVYVHTLPSYSKQHRAVPFNLVRKEPKWPQFLTNHGFGPAFEDQIQYNPELEASRTKNPALFDTYQNNLHHILEHRITRDCRVFSTQQANLFYVPLPVASLMMGTRYGTMKKKDNIAYYSRVKKFLASHPAWQRCNGCDHILTIGRDGNEFTLSSWAGIQRNEFYMSDPFWMNVTKLSTCACATEQTGFAPEKGKDPVYMESEFCFQPPGDNPVRRAFFDSLVAGCVPVIFTPHMADFAWYTPPALLPDISLMVTSYEDTVRQVKEISPDRLHAMQQAIRELIPKILYFQHEGGDAVETMFQAIQQTRPDVIHN
mmetsp:Transcript_41376/g.79125  ORF Transcript_41376/g.79125 Transcript_41376/m.79125 type:complete len:374 (-) Transcript_41376:44-1165(-)